MQEIDFHRALHRPGTIVDAGAHHGGLTLPLAQFPASRVVAFEPVPVAFARLQQAVSAAWGGEVPPHVTLRREALAEHSEAIETWSMSMLCLDDAGLTDVSAIKIDVEGAELEVLRAWMTLRRWRPALSIEIEERHRTGSTRAVPELLHDLG